jgi:hypothetical protein
MSPDNDRCISQASASPNQDKPGTIVAAFSSNRPIIHSSINSVRRDGGVHHRVRTTQVICNSNEQNHRQTSCIRRISGNSLAFDIGSACQYWGRRRYGPAQQVFRIA